MSYNNQYAQCLNNLTARNDINTNVKSLQNTIAFMREQGERLQFFQYLLSECDITTISNNRYCETEIFDISEYDNPILFPVCTVDKTMYDAIALKAVSEKTGLLRNDWKQTREENFKNILAKQERTLSQNWTSYVDIDENIDIEELSVLIEYYEKQSDISAGLFAEGMEQCRLTLNNAEVYPNEDYSGLTDITPLSIDIINIDNMLFDAAAITALETSIKNIRAEWNRYIVSEETKTKECIQERFKNYYTAIAGARTKNWDISDLEIIQEEYKKNYTLIISYNSINMEDIALTTDYITETAGISGDLFLYFYECCALLSKVNSETASDKTFAELDTAPFNLYVIDIDGGDTFSIWGNEYGLLA